ncbi:hypothetical protein [Nonomuraea rhizosphaerae]|uniref:hypothetical protein n=1 Tax=Nonomuraea rhizosphaerae TaxID=2665663 RepID=UPI001C5F78BC|nr:hypothetical protein [Nonomuraea rhizosphaerae]
MRKFLRTVLLTVPLVLALVLPGSPAAAAEPLAYDFGDCDRIPSLIVCTIAYKGGLQPVTIRWYKDGDLKEQYNDKKLFRIGCKVGKEVYIDVVVTDATGDWFKFSTSGTCSNTAD